MPVSDRATPHLHRERQTRLNAGSALAQYAPGRSCSYPDCTARLSRYNPSATCSLHNGWEDVHTRSYG